MKQDGYYREDAEVREQMRRQNGWMLDNKLTATPVILFDGYLFPEEYEVTDLSYLMN